MQRRAHAGCNVGPVMARVHFHRDQVETNVDYLRTFDERYAMRYI
jgi:hypothetical protein